MKIISVVLVILILCSCSIRQEDKEQNIKHEKNEIDTEESIEATTKTEHNNTEQDILIEGIEYNGVLKENSNEKPGMSNSKDYQNNKQISDLINEFSAEYSHEIKIATKEIEQRLYGKWQVGDALGYSLKINITGDALANGKLDLSKEIFRITTPFHLHTDGIYIEEYKSPILVYYQETIDQMKQDDFLDDYSGIEGLNSNTVGTVILALGLPYDSPDTYNSISTQFIIIDDYVIAARQSSFYKLEKLD